jgi:hypothetical protein
MIERKTKRIRWSDGIRKVMEQTLLTEDDLRD